MSEPSAARPEEGRAAADVPLVWEEQRLVRRGSNELLEEWTTSAERRVTPRRTSRLDRLEALPGHIPGETGIWLFIFGDLMVFGWFFCVFLFQRAQDTELYSSSQDSLGLGHGLVNTMLLLVSSWLVATAVRATRADKPHAPRLILGALVCGAAFVGNKALEYQHQVHLHHGPDANEFFSFFFMLTGIHLLHVVIGMGVLLLMWNASRRHAFNISDQRTMESGASFWHLVDLLWIVLFALFYLVH